MSAGRKAALEARPAAAPLAPAGRRLRLLSWNLGYSGLGAESCFIADGGRRLLPPSRAAVAKNQRLIGEVLQARPADLHLLQEVARAGPMTLWRDLLARIDAASPMAARWFAPDLRTTLPPPPLGLCHGLCGLSRLATEAAELIALPSDDKPLIARVRRRYGMLRLDLRFPAPRGGVAGWRVFNLHFSAFDRGATLRKAQLAAALAAARKAYEAGWAVAMGGDWNLALAQTDFPHSTPTGCLEWLHPFPQQQLPEGWRLVCDARAPTVRTVNRPYRRGENFTAVIDGFLVSPNVAVERCETIDLGFEPSDHHPVIGTFALSV